VYVHKNLATELPVSLAEKEKSRSFFLENGWVKQVIMRCDSSLRLSFLSRCFQAVSDIKVNEIFVTRLRCSILDVQNAPLPQTW
jgi:hypothetical protein